ncbi:MAG: class I SAM-dependent methyltransferase [Dehalococcoidia bacterium]|jgi:SAM-dependent methyltransferase
MQGVKPDISYNIEQFVALNERQTNFYMFRTEAAVLEAAHRTNGTGPHHLRLLDVGCGLGTQAAKLSLRGWEAHGIDASDSMLRLGQFRFPAVHQRVRMVRGIAEGLPFQDSSFDLVICQGAMDHFADRQRFVAEAARVLRPGGHLVVALANYQSLSCRIGKGMHRMMGKIGVGTPPGLRYWGIPDDHTFEGSYKLMKRLARGRLRLVGIHGASMFLFLPPWRGFLEMLSFRAAAATFRVVDRLAYRFPWAADVVIATWRKEPTSPPLWLRRNGRGNGKRQSSAVPSSPAQR